MRKHLRIAAIALILSLAVFSCAGQGSSGRDDMNGNPGRNQGGGRPEMPEPTEAELSLLRLESLIENAESEPELAVTAEQAEVIIPILLQWEEAIAENPKAETEIYTDGIEAELTEAQNGYIPGPPGGDAGGPPRGEDGGPPSGSKGQRPPSGGPEKIEISEMLTELIGELSLL